MSNKIAVIKLNKDTVSWYDQVNSIYLNFKQNQADIYDDMDFESIRNGIKYKCIKVIEGKIPDEECDIEHDLTSFYNKKDIDNKFNQVSEQYISITNEKLDKNGIVTMSNMGQDVKEAMTGGSVAVVGKDTILAVNIVNNQVTPPKTSFFNIDEEGNLIDRNNLIKGYYYSITGEITPNDTGYTTDLTEFNKDLEYKFNFVSFVTFWDINKTFINGYIQGSSTPDIPTNLENVPQNAKYVRFSVWEESKNSCVFCKSSNYSKDLKINYILKETTIKEELLEKNLKNKINNITEDLLEENLKNKINNITISDNYFYDKKVTFLGDSITFGVDGGTNGEVVVKPYPILVSELLGCKCVNLGIPGSTIAGDGVTDSEITHNKIGFLPMSERYTHIASDSDYIIVFGGINDYISNVKTPIGTKGDNTKMTFYGALKILLDGLIEKYPNAKLGFVTPLKKSSWFNNNDYDINLEKYYNAIVEMCEERSVPILDFFKNGGCYGEIQAWKNINLPDGLHPTQVYYEKLTRPICEFIKTL